MRLGVSVLALWAVGVPALAATLERLTLEEMAARSTAIVRAKALSSTAVSVGSTIYTRTRFQVLERWKGAESAEVEVFTPGGVIGRTAQHYTGVPQFALGQELVLFLWTGRSGRTQVIGYTQGVFEVARASSSAEPEAVRRTSGEIVLTPGGAPEPDRELRMPLRSLATRVQDALQRSRTK